MYCVVLHDYRIVWYCALLLDVKMILIVKVRGATDLMIADIKVEDDCEHVLVDAKERDSEQEEKKDKDSGDDLT